MVYFFYRHYRTFHLFFYVRAAAKILHQVTWFSIHTAKCIFFIHHFLNGHLIRGSCCPHDIFLQHNAPRIIRAEPFPEAKKPAIKLWLDFGPEIGERKSSAQITRHYRPEELIGKQVLAVVNFPPRQIGPVRSEVLVLGLPDEDNQVVLIGPDKPVPLGGRMF